MRTSFHHQPEAQHPNFPLSTSWQADYPIFWPSVGGHHFPTANSTLARARCPARNKKPAAASRPGDRRSFGE